MKWLIYLYPKKWRERYGNGWEVSRGEGPFPNPSTIIASSLIYTNFLNHNLAFFCFYMDYHFGYILNFFHRNIKSLKNRFPIICISITTEKCIKKCVMSKLCLYHWRKRHRFFYIDNLF